MIGGREGWGGIWVGGIGRMRNTGIKDHVIIAS